MIQVYADSNLIYDSRLPGYELLALKATRGVNKGGTAELTMPLYHPAYNSFVSYRTVLEIYRDEKLIFRGRPLYPTDDYMLRRTITCEGERCFLRDATLRPYLYQDTPKAIFTALVNYYNSQVDDFKQFVVGEVTVTDPNDYVRLEAEEAEYVSDAVDKLVDRCGGSIVFTTNAEGKRVINWYAETNYRSTQVIEFGENLIDFKRSANSELATRIIPYGAKNETTGERLTIKAVNGGLDYVQDEKAVALRGIITKAVNWDDVTTPEALLTKAKQYLAESKNVITSLELTALDLSIIDKTVESFDVGDLIKVRSAPHGVDDYYQLQEQTLDLLNPANDRITLGKSVASLTGADMAGDRHNGNTIQRVEGAVKSQTAAIKQVETRMSSEIKQLADRITLTVSGTLGGTAQIQLTVDGATATQSLDLSAVRKAFANDTTAVTISAGTITFNSGTIIINSDNFQVTADGTITATAGTIGGWTLKGYKLYAGDGVDVKTVCVQAPTEFNLYVFAAGGTSHDSYADCPFRVTKAGKLYATDAVIYGDILTIDGSFKTELDRGSLRLYYDDTLCGTINTKYWSGASTEGISLRIEEAGSYIMFSHPSDAGSGYDVDYYLNYGWSDYYEERHIFQTSARFLDDVWLQRAYARALYLVNGDGTFLVSVNSSGTGLTVSKI